MGLKNVTDTEGDGNNVRAKTLAFRDAKLSLEEIRKLLLEDINTDANVVDTMCNNWRSSAGRSASAFYYANYTLLMMSLYCYQTIGKAKMTMTEFSDDMELIDQDLAAMNFLAVGDDSEGE